MNIENSVSQLIYSEPWEPPTKSNKCKCKQRVVRLRDQFILCVVVRNIIQDNLKKKKSFTTDDVNIHLKCSIKPENKTNLC